MQGSNNILKVLRISPVADRGALKAFVEIQVGQFVFTDCRIIKENGKKLWLSMPVLSYKNHQGTACYKTLVQILDKNLKNIISQAAISAWEKKEVGGNDGTKTK